MTRKADIDKAATDALLRRVFGTSVPVTYQRTPDGVSTQVYRIWRGSEVFYLRIAEEADENLETDAELHRRLRGLGVKVADIVHVEPFNADIGRSTLVTTQVPGVSLAEISAPALAASVAGQAGADLAVINQIPVDGFGFVRRHGRRWPPQAEYPEYENFLASPRHSECLAGLESGPAVCGRIEVRAEVSLIVCWCGKRQCRRRQDAA